MLTHYLKEIRNISFAFICICHVIVRYKEIKLELSWELHPLWLAFKVLESMTQAIDKEKPSVVLPMNLMQLSTCQVRCDYLD